MNHAKSVISYLWVCISSIWKTDEQIDEMIQQWMNDNEH